MNSPLVAWAAAAADGGCSGA